MAVVVVKDARELTTVALAWRDEATKEFNIDFDYEEHMKHLQEMIEDPDSEVIALLNGGEAVGYMGVCTFDSPVGRNKLASEHFWYVRPEYRGISAIRLLSAGIAWAKSRGCSHFIGNASKLASDLHDKVCSIYEKRGMKHFETSYICEVK